MKLSSIRRLVAVLACGLAGSLVVAGVASASTSASPSATATVAGGTLSFVSAPGNITFPPLVLTGTNQTTSTSLALDIGDNTGSGAGWNVTATSTTFSNGTNTLPSGSVSVNAAPPDACDAGSACTLATNEIAYPYVLPEAATAPAATKLLDAAAGTGMGDQSLTPTFTLAVPAGAYSGTYTSTVTFSLVSAP